APRGVALGRREKLVVEAESIEEGLQPRVVVLAETQVLSERVRNLGERLAEMLGYHLLVGNVVGNFAQTVHVVGETDQPRLHLVLGEHAKGMTHHCGAGHLAGGADLWHAARTGSG